MENREFLLIELWDRQIYEKFSLDKVFDEMIGFCLDEGDKIFIEIGIENKKKM